MRWQSLAFAFFVSRTSSRLEGPGDIDPTTALTSIFGITILGLGAQFLGVTLPAGVYLPFSGLAVAVGCLTLITLPILWVWCASVWHFLRRQLRPCIHVAWLLVYCVAWRFPLGLWWRFLSLVGIYHLCGVYHLDLDTLLYSVPLSDVPHQWCSHCSCSIVHNRL